MCDVFNYQPLCVPRLSLNWTSNIMTTCEDAFKDPLTKVMHFIIVHCHVVLDLYIGEFEDLVSSVEAVADSSLAGKQSLLIDQKLCGRACRICTVK